VGASVRDCLLIAAHGWDVTGSTLAGKRAAFLERPGKTLYPLGPEIELADLGLVDVYRSLHGFGDAYSWVLRRKGREVRRRFDHVFSDLRVSSCEYDHAPRLEGLSDHSVLEVELGPGAN
jgi:exonuclease III